MDSPVCYQCFPNHTHLGDITPNLCLIYWKQHGLSEYHIIRADPHDRLVMSFENIPQPMPSESADFEETMDWINCVSKESIVPMAHEEAHEFVQHCMEWGYHPDEHGFLRHWLTDQAGKLLAQRKT